MEHMLKNIDQLKYSELQKVAKGLGIKANVKIDKLQKAVKEYYGLQTQSAKSEDNIDEAKDVESQEKSEGEAETKQAPKRVVKKAKKRRGGRRKAAGKSEDEEENSDGKEKTAATASEMAVLPKPGSRKTTPQNAVARKGVTHAASPMTPQMKAVLNLRQSKTPQSQKRKRSGSLNRPKISSEPKTRTPIEEPSNKRVRRSTFEKNESVPSPQGNNNKRVRRSTFEKKDETTPAGTPNEGPNKRARRSTFEKKDSMVSNKPIIEPSPGVKDMIKAMKPDMNSAERKATLLKALDEKVQKVKGSGTPTIADENKVSGVTQIPRFAAFIAKKKEAAQKKPITPGNKDWTKVHQKEFEKFDSLDEYLKKKRQRTKSITKSMTKVNKLLEESQQAITSLKNLKTPNNENKPKPKPKHDAKQNLFKSPTKPFQPTVFKTKNINTNFGVKTPGVGMDTKTPNPQGSIKKLTPRLGSTIEKKADRKSLGVVSAQKSNGVTPFKFTAMLNTTMPGVMSAKKPAFDLKASLARPMTWKPHKGKLKPVSDASYKGNTGSSVKTPAVESRVDRRAAMAQHRANKKLQSQMNRRGLHA